MGLTAWQLVIYRQEINDGQSSPPKRWRGFFGYFQNNAQSQAFFSVFLGMKFVSSIFLIALLDDKPVQMIMLLVLQSLVSFNCITASRVVAGLHLHGETLQGDLL